MAASGRERRRVRDAPGQDWPGGMVDGEEPRPSSDLPRIGDDGEFDAESIEVAPRAPVLLLASGVASSVPVLVFPFTSQTR